jgi:hypothetical protein
MVAFQSFTTMSQRVKASRSTSSPSATNDTPFLLPNRIDKSLKYVVDDSVRLGTLISQIQLGNYTYPLPSKDDTQLTVYYGGDIDDYSVSVVGQTYSQSVSDGFGGSAQITYDATATATGGASLVVGGFDNAEWGYEISANPYVQYLAIEFTDSGSINLELDSSIGIEVKLDAFGIWSTLYNEAFPVNVDVEVSDAGLDCVLELEIQYNPDTKIASISQYIIQDVSLSPDLQDSWDYIFDETFGSASDWWNTYLFGYDNPFELLNTAVSNQLATEDDYLDKYVSGQLTTLINESDVKPYFDLAFLPLLAYSWNYKDYPINEFEGKFLPDLTLVQDSAELSVLRSNINSVILDRDSRPNAKSTSILNPNFDQLIGERDVVYSRKNKARLKSSGMSGLIGTAYLFGDPTEVGSSKADLLTDFNPEADKILISKKYLEYKYKKAKDSSVQSFSDSASRRDAATSSSPILYNTSTGDVFVNSNGALPGMGQSGGLLTNISESPTLTSENISVV